MIESSLLVVKNLSVAFSKPGWFRSEPVPVVRGVSLEVQVGETVGLVGESGSGKSTLLRAICGLIPQMTGTVQLLGRDVGGGGLSGRRREAAVRQLVFQDPDEALNPRLTVGESVLEPLLAIGSQMATVDRSKTLARLLDQVGLPSDSASRFPHSFSGGQRQRLLLARALSVQPRLLLLDEPTSALDVSVQATLLELMDGLSQELRMARLIVSHDLAVIRHVADRVLVLRGGRVVEHGPVSDVLDTPSHPYTQSLRSAALGLYDEVTPSGRND